MYTSIDDNTDLTFTEVKKKKTKNSRSKVLQQSITHERVRSPISIISNKRLHIYFKYSSKPDDDYLSSAVNIFLVSHGYRPGYLTMFRNMKTFDDYDNIFVEKSHNTDIFNPHVYIYNEDTKSKYKHLIDVYVRNEVPKNPISNLLLGYPCPLPSNIIRGKYIAYCLYIEEDDNYTRLFHFLSDIQLEISDFEKYNEGIHHYNIIHNTNYKLCINIDLDI